MGGGAQSCPTLCDPMDCSPKALLSMGFPRQVYWGGLPFPSLGHLSDPGIKPGSPALQGDSLPSEPPGTPPKPWKLYVKQCKKTKQVERRQAGIL